MTARTAKGPGLRAAETPDAVVGHAVVAIVQAVFGLAIFIVAALVLTPPGVARAAAQEASAPVVEQRTTSGSITIEAVGVRTSAGFVRVAICTARTFLTEDCPFSGSAAAVKGSTLVTVAGIPPGVYAVQLFHDENGNNRVDRGLLGIPKERIGFSNDAPLGPRGPSFAHAAFTHSDEGQTLKVALRKIGPGDF